MVSLHDMSGVKIGIRLWKDWPSTTDLYSTDLPDPSKSPD